MHCDPPLMALLLVCVEFEIEERGRSADHALVHPAQPLAYITFEKVGAMATQQNSLEGQVDRPP